MGRSGRHAAAIALITLTALAPTACAQPDPTAAITQPAATPPPEPLLPDEGQRSASPQEATDWTTDRSPGQKWLLDPCGPTAYPTDRQRVSFRTVSRTGPEYHSARQLGTYPTADVAADVLAGFRRAISACATGRTADGADWKWATRDVNGLGDEAFVAATTVGKVDESRFGARIVVTRVGLMVFMAYGSGEFYTAEVDDEGARAMQDVARRFVDSL
ncbi:hypothetical protein [Pseudonocardia sp. TRM90224]|uniref:hypothetical protein n=1 Tax=Pseudonocardia sp. TRM90224 TaxID=2812678 RepID=UPI001E29A6D4|nr:hypothetical protein [Pseudonocardia sp. TRM90224]